MIGKRTASFIAVGVASAAIATTALVVDPSRGIELDTMDARFSIRGTETPRDDVVVVQIDDATFSELGEQWPFPRSLHGELVDRLSEAGTKAIAYDVQFTERTEPAEDNALIRSVDRAQNVVLGTTEVNKDGESNVFGGEEVLHAIGAESGNTLIESDPGGVVRRLVLDHQGLTNFAVAAAEATSGEEADSGRFGEDGAWIDYAGPSGTIPTVSFSDVIKRRFEPAFFEGKVAVVGASAPTLQDVHPTPFGGRLMSGAEVQANAVATVLDGIPLRSSPGIVDIAVIVILAMVAPLVGLGRRPLIALGVALAGGLVYLLVAQLAFNSGIVLPVLYPLLGLLLGAVGTLALHYLFAAFDRQRVHDTFARFVPANVVNQVLERTDDDLRLGGVRRECTVLFSDIRGFTTFSESLAPDQVVEVLNRYLGEMTDAIMDHGGTLVSYMGDGIMAVFGAPLEQPDHADRAVAAAREMLDVRLPSFNEWMRDAGHGDGFRMGIGLNSGEVMSGQVGSARRLEYTTIGDTVNTGARLEGMTKGTEHQLFVSDSTKAALTGSADALVLVGDLEVRGREGKIRVWSVAEPVADGIERP